MHLALSIWTTATQIQDCSNGENGLSLQYVSQHNYPCQRQNSCDHEYWLAIIWIMWNTQGLILRQWCRFRLDRIFLGFPQGQFSWWLALFKILRKLDIIFSQVWIFLYSIQMDIFTYLQNQWHFLTLNNYWRDWIQSLGVDMGEEC
jgi:hypothetical protein